MTISMGLAPLTLDRFKDYAPVATVISATLALLLDRFRIIPSRYLPYLFWIGALVFLCFYLGGPVGSLQPGNSHAHLEVNLAYLLISIFFLTALIRSGTYVPSVRIQSGPTISKPSANHPVVAVSSVTETIDGYWTLRDFEILARCMNRSTRFKANSTVRLVGGSVLLDAVLYNISGEPILLDEFSCKTRSLQAAYVLSAGPGALPISGVYSIDASIRNQMVLKSMEPRLHVPNGEPVRFLILFTADMTGCTNSAFSFDISLRSGGRRMLKVGPFRLDFSQLNKSLEETTAELKRRLSSRPNDIGTMVHYAQALMSDDRDASGKLFERVREIESNNPDALKYFVENATSSEERIELFYLLDSIRPDISRECAHSAVYALLKRADLDAKKEDSLNAYCGAVREARRIASRMEDSDVPTSLIAHEIVVAANAGDLDNALIKIEHLAEIEEWDSPGRDWQRSYLERLLAGALGPKFDDNMHAKLFGHARAVN